MQEPKLKLIDADFDEKTIWLYEKSIDSQLTKELIRSIEYIDNCCRSYSKHNKQEDIITIRINSDAGGCLDDLFAIIDTVNLCSMPVDIRVEGTAVSAHAFLAICSSGTRYMTKNSTLMIHDVQMVGADQANLKQFEHETKFAVDTRNRLTELIYNRCNKGSKKIKINRDSIKKNLFSNLDIYLNSQQCLELNIIDKIL